MVAMVAMVKKPRQREKWSPQLNALFSKIQPGVSQTENMAVSPSLEIESSTNYTFLKLEWKLRYLEIRVELRNLEIRVEVKKKWNSCALY